MEVARVGWTYKRLLTVLEIVPSCLQGDVVPNIYRHCGERLMIVVLERPKGLQTVELGSFPANTDNAVPHLRGDSVPWLKHQRRHAIVSAAGIGTIGEERIVAIVVTIRNTTPSPRDNRKSSIRVLEADECILLIVVVVV